MYCFYSCAVRVCCNPSGSLSLVHKTKQNKTKHAQDLRSLDLRRDWRQRRSSTLDCNTLLGGCTGNKPLLKFVRDSSDHRWTLPLPSNENNLPGTPPPSPRPRPLLPPTSPAETGRGLGEGAGPSSHSEAPTAGPRAMIGGVYGRCLEGPATPGRDVSTSTRGFSPGGPLTLLGSPNLCLFLRHPWQGAQSSARGPARLYRRWLG